MNTEVTLKMTYTVNIDTIWQLTAKNSMKVKQQKLKCLIHNFFVTIKTNLWLNRYCDIRATGLSQYQSFHFIVIVAKRVDGNSYGCKDTLKSRFKTIHDTFALRYL